MSAAKPSALRAVAVSDAVVLARIAQGDMGALGVLYDRYAPALLRFAHRLEPREGEDIVQMVFLRVMRLSATFDSNAMTARPWLYAIAARVAQERKRAWRRWTRTLMRLSDQTQHGQTSTSEVRRDLDRGLARLSVEKRSVLLLAEVEGFSGEEIASMLSIPIGTVWTRLHHARREMRRGQDEDSR